MHQAYQDVMRIVAKLGKPDLFITFTCNPQWPEIRDELLQGQRPADRPDLCGRVFQMKVRAGGATALCPGSALTPLHRCLQLDALCHLLFREHVLGKPVGHCHVIEFQKRGLPHAHILMILDTADRPRSPADIDRIASAELPGAPFKQRRCPQAASERRPASDRGALCPQTPSPTTPRSALCTLSSRRP